MQASFERALALVLKHEGGYSNHPADPGGATMKGVIQRVYDGYRLAHGLPKQSVRQITDAELLAIYALNYWDKIAGDVLPAGIDYCVFDGAVNSGFVQSGKWLQRALGSLYPGPVDGLIGMGTLGAIRQVNDRAALIARICDQRLAFLKRLKTWPVFGEGWGNRVADVRKAALAWA